MFVFIALIGCASEAPADHASNTSTAPAPAPAKPAEPVGSFTFGWSEYPSWSAFWAMHKAGMIDGDAGELGEFERKHNVDIVLVECTYPACISQYAAGQLDFVALTNLDTLTTGVSSVGVFPTSTSAGGDQGWATKDITSLEDVRKKKLKVYGLSGSVSEYMFRRNLTLAGMDPKDFTWVGEDPGVVTQHIVAGDAEYQVGVVWNPFGLAIRKARADMHPLFTSKPIGGEIVDMVVASEAAMAKPGANEAALALADAYYAFNVLLEGSKRTELLVATGEKFGASDVADMEIAVTETKFYGTPAEGLAVWNGGQLRDTMPIQIQYVMDSGLVTTAPVVAYGAPPTGIPAGQAYLRFDTSIMDALAKPPSPVASGQ